MNFVCIFRPRITGPWQGSGHALRRLCRAVRRVPPTPVFPHSRDSGGYGQTPAPGMPCVPEMYLKISAESLEDPEEMRYIFRRDQVNGSTTTYSNHNIFYSTKEIY